MEVVRVDRQACLVSTAGACQTECVEPLPDLRRTEVLGDKVFRYNMPVEVLYSALTDGRSAWLRLQPGEVEPQVVEAVPWERVVWSSFWPVSPDRQHRSWQQPRPSRWLKLSQMCDSP